MFKRIFGPSKQCHPPAAETCISPSSISLVQGEKDFESLGPIIFEATQDRNVEAVLFSRGKPGAEDAEKGQIGVSVWGKGQDLTSRSWKASAFHSKKKWVGMSTISYQEGDIQEYQAPDPELYKNKPSTLRVDFLIHMNGEYNRLRRKHVNGMKHVSWEALYTLPSAQPGAVGEDLIRWGFHHFNLARETIFTFTENTEPFTSLGWEQVDILNVDPKPWIGSEEPDLMAFKVFVLIREPGELPGTVMDAVGEK